MLIWYNISNIILWDKNIYYKNQLHTTLHQRTSYDPVHVTRIHGITCTLAAIKCARSYCFHFVLLYFETLPLRANKYSNISELKLCIFKNRICGLSNKNKLCIVWYEWRKSRGSGHCSASKLSLYSRFAGHCFASRNITWSLLGSAVIVLRLRPLLIANQSSARKQFFRVARDA